MTKTAEKKVRKQLQSVFKAHPNSEGIVETLIANHNDIKSILDKCKALGLFND